MSRARGARRYRESHHQQVDSFLTESFRRLKTSNPPHFNLVHVPVQSTEITVPITFATLPSYIDRLWCFMGAVGRRPFRAMDTTPNKNIFKKISLILAEAKVCYAELVKSVSDRSRSEYESYTIQELHDISSFVDKLPYPLALYLESIGYTKDENTEVVPILAELQEIDSNLSGALTYAPKQLVPLLRMLRDGVPKNGTVHELILSLGVDSLPGIELEESSEDDCVRLTSESSKFWLAGDKLAMPEDDFIIFNRIIQTFAPLSPDFNVKINLRHGKGTLAQTIQTSKWHLHGRTEFYTRHDVSEYVIKLGVAFGFCNYKGHLVQPSRYHCTYSTSYWRGEEDPSFTIDSIIHSYERDWSVMNDSSDSD